MKKNASPLHGSTIAKITLAKILKMPVHQYIRFIDRKTNGLHYSGGSNHRDKSLSFYATVIPHNGRFELQIADERLVRRYLSHRSVVPKIINTRNELSRHVVAGLLDYQREFWNTGKESAIRPLTLKQFTAMFPHQRLDESRLSRLVSHLSLQTRLRAETQHFGVQAREGTIVRLRKLFMSKRRFFANLIKEIVDQSAVSLTDQDIRTILREKHGISLSSRSICNCRSLLGIPNFRKRTGCYYPKNVSFSSYIALSPKQARRIPAEPGVYELSIPSKIAYPKGASNVIYIGTSNMLRRRIASYCNGRSKNSRLAEFFGGDKVYVRYLVCRGHLEFEKRLLRCFKKHFGKLPKGNLIGEHYGQPA